ncbi:hypothetical protein D3C76_1213290 [compost metagenome]
MRLACQNLEGLLTVLRHQHVVTLTLEVVLENHANHRFVFDHQYYVLRIFTHANALFYKSFGYIAV